MPWGGVQIHSHVAERETGQPSAGFCPGRSGGALNLSRNSSTALPHRERRESDFTQKRGRKRQEKNAVEQQPGRETEGETREV